MPCWQSLFFQPLGTQILGKVSWWMKHLKRSRVCPAKRLLWRCPSRRLLRVGYPLLPSFHTYHIKIKALLVSGSLVVNHAHWLQLLCPPCPWQWQAAMTSTPGDLYRSLTATSAQLRLRSPGWVWWSSQWRRCQGCYYPKLKSSKRCPKLTETDCFEQIQGWRWRLKTLSFSPIGFLSNLFCTNLHLYSICPNHLAPRVLHCPKAM